VDAEPVDGFARIGMFNEGDGLASAFAFLATFGALRFGYG